MLYIHGTFMNIKLRQKVKKAKIENPKSKLNSFIYFIATKASIDYTNPKTLNSDPHGTSPL